MSSDNILVIGRWPKEKGEFEYRVADVGFSQYSSTYGSENRQITPGDAACVVKDFCNCEVFPELRAARAEARRIRKEYFAFELPLEYGTTNHEFEQTFSQLIAMALDITPAAWKATGRYSLLLRPDEMKLNEIFEEIEHLARTNENPQRLAQLERFVEEDFVTTHMS